QLATGIDGGQYRLPPLLEGGELLSFFFDGSDGHFVETVRLLFAIARDEGDGRPAGEQSHDRADGAGLETQGFGDVRREIDAHAGVLSLRAVRWCGITARRAGPAGGPPAESHSRVSWQARALHPEARSEPQALRSLGWSIRRRRPRWRRVCARVRG